MRKYKRAKSAKSGAEKGFKAKFKNTVFLPALKERLAAGRLKHGWQAAFAREMVANYEFEVMKAQRKRIYLPRRDTIITEKTLINWIKEAKVEAADNEGKSAS